MQFVLLCDLLPAPTKAGVTKTLLGMRLTGARVEKEKGEDLDLDKAFKELLGDLVGKPVPGPPVPGVGQPDPFGGYVGDLYARAAPLFLWLGGDCEIKLSAFYAEKGMAPTGPTPAPPIIPYPRPLPAPFKMSNDSYRGLLFAALNDLTRRTSSFSDRGAFLRAAWSDQSASELVIENEDGPASFYYEAFLGALASLPSPLPHGRLNLCRFAEIDPIAPNGTQRRLVIAAPSFKSSTSLTWYEPQTDHPDWPPQADGGLVAQISYPDFTSAAGKKIKIIARCRPVDLDEDLDDKTFVQRRTLWVCRDSQGSSGTHETEGVVFEDWLSKLPQRLADAFDLPRLLIDIFEADALTHGAPITTKIQNSLAGGNFAVAQSVTRAVLFALRDTVGSGCIGLPWTDDAQPAPVLTGPNGSPAHEGLIDLVNQLVEEARKDDALGEDKLRELKKRIVLNDSSFRQRFRASSTTPPDDKEIEWFGTLATVLGTTFGIPAASIGTPDARTKLVDSIANEVAIDARSSGRLDMTPLRRVVDAATAPETVAAIQIELWRTLALDPRPVVPRPAPPPYLENWLRAAGPAFARLIERGFRVPERLRKANIDLPWVDTYGLWRRRGKSDDSNPLPDVMLLRLNILDTCVGYALGTVCGAGTQPTEIENSYQEKHGRFAALPADARDLLGTGLCEIIEARVDGKTPDEGWFPRPQQEGGAAGDLLVGGLSAEAHGVALQIDRLIVKESKGPDPQSDAGNFNEDLAGYGILMRRSQPSPPEPWRCLNATAAQLDPEGELGVERWEVDLDNGSGVLGPLPVTYVAKMPQAVVIYDNRPIVGDDPSFDNNVDNIAPHKPPPRILRLYQAKASDLGDRDPAILPFLAYGAVYEVAPFAFSNQGAMPAEIRNDAHPALLDRDKLAPANSFLPNNGVLRRFAYLRRTGIGSLRVNVTGQAREDIFHPMRPPREVKPLANEILLVPDALPSYSTPRAKTRRPLKMKTALLLADDQGAPLNVGTNEFGGMTLTVEAPVTTLEDFDRWMAFEEVLVSGDGAKKDRVRKFRNAVRGTYQDHVTELTKSLKAAEQAVSDAERALIKAQASGNAADVKKAEKDLAATRDHIPQLKSAWQLQDPAVEGLVIEVTRVRRNGKPTAVTESFFHNWKWDAKNPPGVPANQPFEEPFGKDKDRKPISLRFTIDDATPDAGFFNTASLLVRLKASDVIVLRLFAAVPQELLGGDVQPVGNRRFDASIARDFDADLKAPSYPANGTVYRLFSTYSLAVEAATPNLPVDTELAETISATVVRSDAALDEKPGAIRLSFTRKPGAPMDAIGSMAVGSQAWRWTGRPLSHFPFRNTAESKVLPTVKPDPKTKIPLPSEFALLWDVEGFAERIGDTLDEQSAAAPLSEDERGNSAPIRVGLRTPSRDGVARYMRFRITAQNRYAAAYRAVQRSDLGKPTSAKWEKNGWSTPWYRVLRPAELPRVSEDPPPELPPALVPNPGIRALIPLTRALQRGDKLDAVAGVLVVVDGAWFELAGLAEWFLADVEVARRYYGLPGEKVKMEAAEFGADPLLRKKGRNDGKLVERVPLVVAGPLGHGFDTGTATGLYLNSSFVVRAPEAALKEEENASAWWMGKLAFRRLLLAEASKDYWAGSELADGTAARSYSIVSDPASPQVSATLHDVAPAGAGDRSLKVTISGSLSGVASPEQLELDLSFVAATGWTVNLGGQPIANFADGSMDLRVIAARRVSRKNTDKEQRYVWYESHVLLRAASGHWFTVLEEKWFATPPSGDIEMLDASLKLAIELKPTGSVSYAYCPCRLFQVSDATEGRWAQFLPNSEILARSARVPLNKLRLEAKGKSIVLSTETGGGMAWLGTDALLPGNSREAGNEDQRLFNLLLVTRRIASVAGAEEEAYVGLYYSNTESAGAPGGGLQWFGPGDGPDLTGADLIGRIITVRAGRPVGPNDVDQNWKLDPWAQFFPKEGRDHVAPPDGSRVFGVTQPSDAALHIIEIYAPIGLQR